MNAINYLIISYFGAVLFPVDLVTKRSMLEVARRESFRLFSRIVLRDEHDLLTDITFETIFLCIDIFLESLKCYGVGCDYVKGQSLSLL